MTWPLTRFSVPLHLPPLINDILDFSKIEAGKLDLEAVAFDLLHELETLAASQALAAQSKGLELVINYPAHVPHMLVGDPGRISQVVVNLMSNAIKFTSAGTILVEVQQAGRGADSCRLRVAVSDTGIGLEADKLDTIFDKFTQADSSTTRQYGGTGLGLTICKLLVEMMGGTIGAASTPGQGSTFWFELELGLAAHGAVAPAAGTLAGMRVLCIDSHETQCAARMAHFGQFGIVAHSVCSALAGFDALTAAAAAGEPYAVALVDHQLPDLDPETFGAMVKADARLSATLLVIVSALAGAADNERFAHAGYAAFLSKPVPQQILIDTLKALRTSLAIGMPLPFMNCANLAVPGASEMAHQAAPLAGYRILAVDDNPVNLQVVSHMLERLGAEVELAENGRVAVHMFLAKPFDMILMDCQMPELDGYQAAAEIRHLETTMLATPGPGARTRMPVIALTAHALEGEREKCIKAGMDDFLTKPLRAAALREKLVGWLAPSQAALEVAPDPESPGDALEAVRQMFGAKYPELVQLFLDDAPRRLTALASAVDAGDLTRVADCAHTLAGSAGAVGAEALSLSCKTLEMALRAGDDDGIDAGCAVIRREYARIDARLQELLAPHA